MPYITQNAREIIDKDLASPRTVGELNYKITRLVDGFISQAGLSYTTVNNVVGVLECAKLELYRRVAVPYEEKKRSESGEVYVNV
jgi:hypothetical protein